MRSMIDVFLMRDEKGGLVHTGNISKALSFNSQEDAESFVDSVIAHWEFTYRVVAL